MRSGSQRERQLLTARGAATKARIVEAAATLIYVAGADRVSLDEIMEASGTSKSQLYHYFSDKDALVREVIGLQAGRILDFNATLLDRLGSIEGLHAWRDMLIAAFVEGGAGCPLGSLANELASRSEDARRLLDGGFKAWGAAIGGSLARMKQSGHLAPDADTEAVATAVLAAIQGGMLLSKTARSTRPLELAFDMALHYIERAAVQWPGK